MLKTHKQTLLITSVVILLPILAGLLLWDRLPDTMTTHWGPDGNADGWGSKVFAVFGLPLILLCVHWLCVWVTGMDPKNQDGNRKMKTLVLWLMPVLSVLANGTVYATALGVEPSMNLLICPLLGVMFLVLGNYLPKCKQNFTMGIKLPWTFANEENWNKTHRLGGIVWVVCGIIMLLCSFLPEGIMAAMLVVVMIAAIAIPLTYSYTLYRKHTKAGIVYDFEYRGYAFNKTALVISTVLLVVVLAGVAVLMITGEVTVTCGDTAFTVNATYWEDLTLNYADVENIEFRESCDPGVRTNGFGGPRVLYGIFRNDEFGSYTRYSYTPCDAAVILTVGGETLVIGAETTAATQALYHTLVSCIP